MKKAVYTLFSMVFFLPMTMMAQNDITVVVDNETQTVRGSVITISDTAEEYVDTDTKLYKVTDKNLALLGDIIKDQIININDVTALVDMVLTCQSSVVADINEDGKVNINDVTGEVDVALGLMPQKQYVESYVVDDITDVWIKSTTASAIDQH